MNNSEIIEWKSKLTPALKSKQFEFKMMGYKDISTNDIWECLLEKVWKNQSFPPLYQVVQDILHLPIQVYMSYLTLNAYQVTDDDLMASIRAVTDNEIH